LAGGGAIHGGTMTEHVEVLAGERREHGGPVGPLRHRAVEAAVPRLVLGGMTRPTRVRASHAGAREGDAIDRRLRLTPARERVPTESNEETQETRKRRTVEPPREPRPAGPMHQ